MNGQHLSANANALQTRLFADIPMTRTLKLSIAAYDGDSLTLVAPLTPNINDKGCAFGGSLVSLMTLAGWGLIELATNARALECDIYVKDSSIRYLAPVWQDFAAIARLPQSEGFDEFFASLAQNGKGRLRVHCRVPLPEGGDAAILKACYVAVVKGKRETKQEASFEAV
ncbi:MAG: thioesterase domain-containing protein [Rhodanobacter sp.]|nr:thioesterase domain-containing protein [Rhodanobacter sp.]